MPIICKTEGVKNLDFWVDIIYFDLITFTTIGYGDIQPVGSCLKILAGLEGFFGVYLISALLVTLTKKGLW